MLLRHESDVYRERERESELQKKKEKKKKKIEEAKSEKGMERLPMFV